MQDDILIQISNKIKGARKSKNATVQELATKAQVSKGLISQVENNRTIPSLPVLLSIIKALNLDLNDFFKDITPTAKTAKVVIKTAAEYTRFEKEKTRGFVYKRIMAKELKNLPVDIVLLELKRGARRQTLVKTQAYEFKYIIKGAVKYLIDGKTYELKEGDSIFFDGRLGHTLSNAAKKETQMLVVYFFISNNEPL
jgi:transcriptional regulator with XRE-family HTH domain